MPTPKKPQVTSSVETITPGMATELLNQSTTNRSVRPSRVLRYVEVMLNGGWHLNGQTIKIDYNGDLMDGQHRLLAVEEAGIPIDFVVVRGLDPATRSSVDTGARRTLADWFKMNGETDPINLATAVNWYFRLAICEDPRIQQNQYPTYDEAYDLLQNHPALRELSHEWRGRFSDLTGRTSLLIALLYWFDEYDSHARKDFMDKLREGTGLERGNPILALRRLLYKDRVERATSKAGADTGVVVAALVIKAFNYWRTGRAITILSWKPGQEEFPRPLTAKGVANVVAGKTTLS